MMNKQRLTYIILSFLAMAILHGCSVSTPPAAENGFTYNGKFISAEQLQHSINNARQNIQPREAEMHLHRLSEELQGFGGAYMDRDGNYVMVVTPDSPHEIARNVAAKQMNERSTAEYGGREVRIEIGQFEFTDLALWRELITGFVLTNDDLRFAVSNQVDEVRNKIVIGVNQQDYHEANLEKVRDFIGNVLQIPVDAVEFEAEFPELEESDAFSTLSGRITQTQRPLIGGLRVNYIRGGSSSGSTCTMGFLALYDDQEVFVTNAHCTENPHHGPVSQMEFYQESRHEPENLVGVEYKDGTPELDTCITPNPDGWPCRWSDSALISINDGVPRERGFIAKTVRESDDWMVNGSRSIDETDPVFTIQETEVDVVLGMKVHKVGGSSGWTSGEVIRTCVDSRRSSHQVFLLCQHRAKYGTDGGGTSGSPVFVRLASDSDVVNPVALVGIHRASSNRDHPDGYSAFSPFTGVMKDFPGLYGFERNPGDGGGGDPFLAEDCKDGKWESFGFRNQGQCIRYVNTGQDSR